MHRSNFVYSSTLFLICSDSDYIFLDQRRHIGYSDYIFLDQRRHIGYSDYIFLDQRRHIGYSDYIFLDQRRHIGYSDYIFLDQRRHIGYSDYIFLDQRRHIGYSDYIFLDQRRHIGFPDVMKDSVLLSRAVQSIAHVSFEVEKNENRPSSSCWQSSDRYKRASDSQIYFFSNFMVISMCCKMRLKFSALTV